jgi:hypothetical protein
MRQTEREVAELKAAHERDLKRLLALVTAVTRTLWWKQQLLRKRQTFKAIDQVVKCFVMLQRAFRRNVWRFRLLCVSKENKVWSLSRTFDPRRNSGAFASASSSTSASCGG